MTIRINRYFTENGIISRREADRAIQEGRISINGRTAKLGDQVAETDIVSLDGKVVSAGQKHPVILAYNKPVGIECTTDQSVPNNIIDAVRYPQRIFTIGRLDKDSEGLILLTNIGDIVNKILRARFRHEKEYIVEANGYISDQDIEKLRQGVILEDGMTLPCRIERLAKRRIRMVLTEGRNRQIRRMIDAIGLRVVKLRRIRVMNIELGKLPVGTWRQLRKEENSQLFAALETAAERH